MIYDPAAKSQTICTIAVRKCVVSDYQAKTSFKEMPAGPFDGGKRYLNRESLGSSTMGGLEVTGTLETITVNTATADNETPFVSTREFWYFPELQTNPAVTRKLPVEGLQVVQLSDVNASEPAPELFQAPAGFTIEDVRTTKR